MEVEKPICGTTRSPGFENLSANTLFFSHQIVPLTLRQLKAAHVQLCKTKKNIFNHIEYDLIETICKVSDREASEITLQDDHNEYMKLGMNENSSHICNAQKGEDSVVQKVFLQSIKTIKAKKNHHYKFFWRVNKHDQKSAAYNQNGEPSSFKNGESIPKLSFSILRMEESNFTEYRQFLIRCFVTSSQAVLRIQDKAFRAFSKERVNAQCKIKRNGSRVTEQENARKQLMEDIKNWCKKEGSFEGSRLIDEFKDRAGSEDRVRKILEHFCVEVGCIMNWGLEYEWLEGECA